MTHKIEDHECFDKFVDVSESDATFEKVLRFDSWVINLYNYTPSLNISTIRGYYIPDFCPMCGEDFRDDQSNDQEK